MPGQVIQKIFKFKIVNHSPKTRGDSNFRKHSEVSVTSYWSLMTSTFDFFIFL